MKKVVNLLLCVLIAFTGSANDFTDATQLLSYKLLSVEDMTCSVNSPTSKDISGNIKIPETITYKNHVFTVVALEDACFEFCKSISGILLPKTIKKIGHGCFQCCDNLNRVILNDGLKKIDGYAFASCISLSDISIPPSISELDKSSFYNCPNLTNVRFEDASDDYKAVYIDSDNMSNYLFDNVTDLYLGRLIWFRNPVSAGYHYNWCSKVPRLRHLTIGPKITSFFGEARNSWCFDFSESMDLETIQCLSNTPPFVDSFTDTQYMNVVVKVPTDALSSYMTADKWKSFWNLEANSHIDDTFINEKPTISISEMTINIEALTNNEEVQIYNMSGASIYHGYERSILIPNHGTYLIRIGNEVIKINI